MNMEFGNLEVWAITGLAGLLIAGFVIRMQVRKSVWKNDLRSNLEGIISVTDFVPYKTDYFAKKALALDLRNKKLIYLDHANDTNNVIIDTNDLQECRLIRKNLCVKIDLIFTDPDKQRRSIIFYQRYVNPEFTRSGLTVKARYWKHILTQQIPAKEELPVVQIA